MNLGVDAHGSLLSLCALVLSYKAAPMHVINSGASSTHMFRVRANIDTGRLARRPSIDLRPAAQLPSSIQLRFAHAAHGGGSHWSACS